MTEVTKETLIRAIVINIEEDYNAFVTDEITTAPEFVTDALECYQDMTKYRIVTV